MPGRTASTATWVTTSDAYQAKLAPGYPAYTAAAAKWISKQQASGYWANNISAPITAAASQLAYQCAFTQNNFNGAAALSIDLLIVALACAGILIARGRLFQTD